MVLAKCCNLLFLSFTQGIYKGDYIKSLKPVERERHTSHVNAKQQSIRPYKVKFSKSDNTVKMRVLNLTIQYFQTCL